MKRRALLAGAILMPTAVRAQNRQPTKPPPPPPPKAAKTQLIAFNASPFPYRGLIPGTTKPFLDARDAQRRGHTTGRGDVYWEDPTYSDRRSLLYLPTGFDPARPVLIVL